MSRLIRSPGAPPPERALVPYLYGDLRERIVTTSLTPGEPVSESRIAEQYGVSRTPVREAFKRLAEEGLLEVVPQVGTFVSRIDLRHVRDSRFVRETLECRLAELACERIDDAGRERLRANLAEQRRAIAVGDVAAFFRADEAMHETLACIAGHAGAWQIVHAAKIQLDRVRHLSLASAGRSRLRLAEHRAVVEAVLAGDARAAAAAMHAHLASSFEAIAGIATEHARFFTDSSSSRPAA